jgi:hypothetical protein
MAPTATPTATDAAATTAATSRLCFRCAHDKARYAERAH